MDQNNVYSATFLEPSKEGIFINLERVGESRQFLAYVNETFGEGYYYSELNYEVFHGILYDFENFKRKNKIVMFAKAIVDPPAERKPLYDKQFKIINDTAYYEFGPIYIKGEGDRDMEAAITFDELVAAAWTHQIRFGLNADGIRQNIKSGFRGMGVIAKPTIPIKGEDARLEYKVRIKKDLTPVEDSKTGRMDLKRCKCTFPQIPDLRQNRIVRKFDASKGTPGYCLNGNMIPPKAGLDIDLKALADEGTELVIENDIECLVASRPGYIIVNPKSNKISVTSDPQNHSPIGPETGSLEIRTDCFTQYGDILNGYSVKCKGINVVDGTVSGEIISETGEIDIQGSVNSGRLIARSGIIRVKGLVSLNSVLESLKGDIIVDTAENSTLIGKNISVRLAVNCNIIGENIAIGTVQSCKVRGLSVCIENSEVSGTNSENTEVIIPILDMTDKRIRSITQILEEKKARLNELAQRVVQLKENNVLLAFLQAIKARNEQAINTLRRHATPIANEITKLSKELETYNDEAADIEKRLKGLQEEHDRNINDLQNTQKCGIVNPLHANISLKLYGGLDWPLHFELLGPEEDAAYKNFMELVGRLTKGFSNYKRRGYIQVLSDPCSYDHSDLLKLYEKAKIIDATKGKEATIHQNNACTADFRESRINVLSEDDFRSFVKERKWPSAKKGIEINVDGIFKGYLYDFSTGELSMLLDKGQRWRPTFEKGERLKLVATIFDVELKHDLIISRIDEKADLLVVGGYFVNISSEDEDRIYKLKNRYEVLRKSSDQRS